MGINYEGMRVELFAAAEKRQQSNESCGREEEAKECVQSSSCSVKECWLAGWRV